MPWPKKEKPRPAAITLWDSEGRACYDGELAGLVLPEAVVLSLSVKFFDDPEPCYIHRGAVLTRALAELAHALPAGVRVPVGDLPDALGEYLSGYAAAWAELRP